MRETPPPFKPHILTWCEVLMYALLMGLLVGAVVIGFTAMLR